MRARQLGERVWRPLAEVPGAVVWLRPPSATERRQPIGVLLDSTGLSVRGAGSYRESRPVHSEADRAALRKRRTYLKLHPVVNPVTGEAIGAVPSPADVADPVLGAAVIREATRVGWQIRSAAADGIYDTADMYAALTEAGCCDIRIPLKKGAAPWDTTGPHARAGAEVRNRHWARTVSRDDAVAAEQRAAWKVEIGYHVRSLVGSWMSRVWAHSSSRCRARSEAGRRAEVFALIRCMNADAARGLPVRRRRAWVAGWAGGEALAPAA